MMTFNTDTYFNTYKFDNIPEYFREERFGFWEHSDFRKHYTHNFLNKFFHIFS